MNDQRSAAVDHNSNGHDTDQPLDIAVLAISSSPTASEDTSGPRARELLETAGHTVITEDVVDDETIIAEIVGLLAGDVDVVVTTGGTGLTSDDVIIEALRPLFDTEIPSVSEYFQSVCHDKVGSTSMFWKATAGIADGTAIYAFPGNPDAVKLGIEEVLLPELDHIFGVARR